MKTSRPSRGKGAHRTRGARRHACDLADHQREQVELLGVPELPQCLVQQGEVVHAQSDRRMVEAGCLLSDFQGFLRYHSRLFAMALPVQRRDVGIESFSFNILGTGCGAQRGNKHNGQQRCGESSHSISSHSDSPRIEQHHGSADAPRDCCGDPYYTIPMPGMCLNSVISGSATIEEASEQPPGILETFRDL